MTKQTFLQGTLILIFAGVITRLLGFINRLVVARVMGEEGIGLYMMALPTMMLFITVTQLGLPIAISKRVAEANANNDTHKIKRIMVVAFIITMITSMICTLLLFFSAPFIAENFFTDPRTIYPLYAVCPIIPVMAFAGILKGYFQGMQNMRPQSFALVLEQVVRIACVALLIQLFLPFGIEFAAAGAMVSVIFGEAASLIYMFVVFKRRKTIRIRNDFFSFVGTFKKTVKELFTIAIPSTGSRLVNSFSTFLEPIIITQALAITGISSAIATKQYGELTGYVMPLLFLPTFITHSLSIALLPSIAEAEATKNNTFILHRIHQAIRISFASGAIATIVLSLFASQILMYMYGTSNASTILTFMAPFFLFLYIQAPLQAALQALDLAKPAMWNSLFGTTIKLGLLFTLTSHPSFGIFGAAIAMSISVVFVTLLHIRSLNKWIQFSIPLADLAKMLGLVGSTWLVARMLHSVLVFFNNQLLIFIGICILLFIIYCLFLLLFRFLTREELSQIPFIQKWI